MKSVCTKHEQAYEDSCPYCEKKAEGPTAAPAAPPAPMLGGVPAIGVDRDTQWRTALMTYAGKHKLEDLHCNACGVLAHKMPTCTCAQGASLRELIWPKPVLP